MVDNNDKEKSKTPLNKKKKSELPGIFMTNFDDFGSRRPWRQPGQDITDYFNYGFTEETWSIYARQIRTMHERTMLPNPQSSENILLNTALPVDLGGFGQAISEHFVSSEISQLFWKFPEKLLLSFNPGSDNFYSSFEVFLNNVLQPGNADSFHRSLIEELEDKNALLSDNELLRLKPNLRYERNRRISYAINGKEQGNQFGTSNFKPLIK